MALSHGVWREDNPSVSTVLPQDPGPGNLGAAGGGEAAVSPSSVTGALVLTWDLCLFLHWVCQSTKKKGES